MIEVGSDSSGGGAGSSLWKKIGAPPGIANEIELDTGAGVTGIQATNPHDTRFSLFLSKIGAIPVALVSFVGAAGSAFVGLFEDAGTPLAGAASTNAITADSALIAVDRTGTGAEMTVFNGVNLLSKQQADSTQNVITVSETTTFDRTVRTQTRQVINEQVFVTGALSIGTRLDSQRFTVRDIGGLEVFGIKRDGKIETNQVNVALGNDNLPFEKIEIFNAAGVSQGFIPVLVDPGTAHYVQPVITAGGGGAGVGAAFGITGTDLCGQITIITGAVPIANIPFCRITFAAAFILQPLTMFCAANNNAAAAMATVYSQNLLPTNFELVASAPLTPFTQYIFNYSNTE